MDDAKHENIDQASRGKLGGAARARRLSAEERSQIAKTAAQARWGVDKGSAVQLKPVHSGVLHLGSIAIPCAVLPDGTRVLSARGVIKALGINRGGSHWRRKREGDHGADLPIFASAPQLKPFIDAELSLALASPIMYKHQTGGIAHGARADLVPSICEIWLRARDAKALLKGQQHIAVAAEILIRSLAHVGIVALVDEATGYQETRAKDALQELLDRYLRQEFAAWAKKFPDEFYQNIYRLRGWTWKGRSVNPPGAVAHYTNNLVYARLAPGILTELKIRNPRIEGHRKGKHHQLLTEDIGHPSLSQHLYSVMSIMKSATTWDQMMNLIDLIHPKKGDTLQLELLAWKE